MFAFVWSACVNLDFRGIQRSIGFAKIPSAGASHPSHVIIDINKAGALEFDLLPGIGPTIANRIVQDRDARGRFLSVASMSRVSGIGPRTIDSIEKYCVIGDTIKQPLVAKDPSLAMALH